MPDVPFVETMSLEFHPVTAARLPDLVRFSAAHGKFRYCSCMRWRMTSSQFQRSSRPDRETALRTLVEGGTPVGVLAYADGEPVGWCSIGPRNSHAALERYRKLPRVDGAPVWSVVCFFVDSRFRRQGLTVELLKAAVGYAGREGADIVEGYPVEPGARSYTYMGSPRTFERAGFEDVTPPGRERRVMRRFV
jgi:GNAT superfamily N-acetyltransferase